jgi:hypothetical protein
MLALLQQMLPLLPLPLLSLLQKQQQIMITRAMMTSALATKFLVVLLVK